MSSPPLVDYVAAAVDAGDDESAARRRFDRATSNAEAVDQAMCAFEAICEMLATPHPPAGRAIVRKSHRPVPLHLLNPPGLVGDICSWIDDTATHRQPELTLGHALAFFGAVLGRKVATPSNLRTNVYAVGVGGVDDEHHARDCVFRLCSAAGLSSDLMIGDCGTSAARLLAGMHARPSAMLYADAAGTLLPTESTFGRYDQIREVLVRLFTSAHTPILKLGGKGLLQRDLCVHTAARREQFEAVIGVRPPKHVACRNVQEALLARLLVFQAFDNGDERDATTSPPPTSVVQAVQGWFGNKPAKMDSPDVVNYESSANAIFSAFGVEARTQRAAHNREASGLRCIWTRASEHAQKVALIVACGCDGRTPLVSEAVAEWAVGLVRHLTESLVDAFGDVSQSHAEATS